MNVKSALPIVEFKRNLVPLLARCLLEREALEELDGRQDYSNSCSLTRSLLVAEIRCSSTCPSSHLRWQS